LEAAKGALVEEPDSDASRQRPGNAENGRVTSYQDRAAARQALRGSAGQAANRFFRGATGKSRDFQTTDLGDEGFRLEYFSPARNPGYEKRYVQVIDLAGNVLREYKETWGPDDLIEPKWVHGAPL
jgi:hypothetical protein